MTKRITTCIAMLCLTFPSLLRADDANKEYLVKAAFMYNFVKFIEWPGDKAVAKQTSINICIVGSDPFGAATSVFKQASTASLALNVVRTSETRTPLADCHIAFISNSEEGRVSEILASTKNSPILTVSDINDFAGKGGIVGFAMQDNKVKLIVNTKAASAAGLRVDAQLLEIALTVIR